MQDPLLSPDEPFRLRALRDAKQLDTPLDERFERITRLAQRMLGTSIAAISLVDADRQWFKSIQGLNITETSRNVSFCGHTILQDEVLVIPDARKDARFSDNPLVSGAPHIVFYAGCPIRAADGSKIGSLCVIDQKTHSFSSEDIQILRDLAAVAENEFSSSAADTARLQVLSELNATKLQAQVDSLTRIWNRESIFKQLEVELARAKRACSGAGIIMADVDYFKQINDTHGHSAGDEVLRQTAKRMLGAIREVDALGRYGGEEFLIALGTCNGPRGAITVAERVRQRIAEKPYNTEFGKIPCTLSLGVTYFESVSNVTGQMLIRSADAALYRAKQAGRNCVESDFVSSSHGLQPVMQ